MSDPSTKDHVRLKPLNPAAGQTKRDYNAPWGHTYKTGVWYVEPAELAGERVAYLNTVHQNSSDDFSPKAFDLCTRAEAERLKLYEESGELEKVVAASKPAVPPAPTTTGSAAVSQDLNLPSPKSELAAAAQATAVEAEAARAPVAVPDEAPKEASSAKPKRAKVTKAKAKPRARRRNPGR
jgi:hypothetical protein